MPHFCRHGRLLQNCPICSKEEQAAVPPPPVRRAVSRTSTPRKPTARRGSNLRVRHLGVRGADDGYASGLVPGLRSSEDATRLAEEIAAGQAQLAAIGPAAGDDLSRLFEDVLPLADDSERALAALPAWLERHGAFGVALAGDPTWSPERRFGRAYERLGLPGLGRGARFELLVQAGGRDLLDVQADALHFGGEDAVTVAAKRVFGIGDSLLLERRAAALAEACGVDLAALDGALRRFEEGPGDASEKGEPEVLAQVRVALALA